MPRDVTALSSALPGHTYQDVLVRLEHGVGAGAPHSGDSCALAVEQQLSHLDSLFDGDPVAELLLHESLQIPAEGVDVAAAVDRRLVPHRAHQSTVIAWKESLFVPLLERRLGGSWLVQCNARLDPQSWNLVCTVGSSCRRVRVTDRHKLNSAIDVS